jgi:hypothetical protein
MQPERPKEVAMGRFCAWCGSIMLGIAGSRSHVNDAICDGCVEELEATLDRVGLRLTKAPEVAIGR